MVGTNLIREYLDENMVDYALWPDITGEIRSFPFNGTVNTVLLKIDGDYALMVLKHFEDIDIDRMKIMLKTNSIAVVQEDECNSLFPSCDATALPILGTLIGMPVYCSTSILSNREICFNPGTHDKVVQVHVDDFVKLEHPTVGNFAIYGYKESKYEFIF